MKQLLGATKLRPLKGAKLHKLLDNLKSIQPESGAKTNEILYDQVDKVFITTFMQKFDTHVKNVHMNRFLGKL